MVEAEGPYKLLSSLSSLGDIPEWKMVMVTVAEYHIHPLYPDELKTQSLSLLMGDPESAPEMQLYILYSSWEIFSFKAEIHSYLLRKWGLANRQVMSGNITAYGK